MYIAAIEIALAFISTVTGFWFVFRTMLVAGLAQGIILFLRWLGIGLVSGLVWKTLVEEATDEMIGKYEFLTGADLAGVPIGNYLSLAGVDVALTVYVGGLLSVVAIKSVKTILGRTT